MKLSNSVYANWMAVVDKLEAVPADVIVYYFVDLSIAKVAEIWAIISPAAPLLIYGTFGNQGPAPATVTGKYTGAVAVTTAIGVSES